MNGQHKNDPERRKDRIASEYHLAVSVDCVIFGYDEEGLKVLLIIGINWRREDIKQVI